MQKINENFFLDSKINYFFILSFLLISSVIIFKVPSLSTQPEVYAETGTIFFQQMRDSNFWDALKITEAGYQSLLQKTISLIVIKLFGITKEFPYVFQFISIAFIAFFSSIINLRTFRNLIKSDIIRFIAGITISFFPSYEVLTFICFGYFGVTFILLMMYYDKEKLKLPIFIPLLILNFLLLASKPTFLVFVPFYIYFLVHSIIKKQFKNISYYSFGIASAILQYITLKTHSLSIWKVDMTSTLGIVKIILSFSIKAFYFQIHHYTTIIFYYFTIMSRFVSDIGTLVFITIFLIFTVVFYLLFKIYKKEKKVAFYFFILCNILAFGAILLAIITVTYLENPNWTIFADIPFKRYFLFSYVFIYLALVVLITNSLNNKKLQLISIIYISFQFTAFGFAIRDKYSPKKVSYSQWEIYKNLLDYPDYYIPINPYPWAISKNIQEIKFIQNSKINQLLGVKLRAAIINIDSQNNSQLFIRAYDEFGKIAGHANQITPVGYKYCYFLFEEKISPHSLIISSATSSSIKKIEPADTWIGRIIFKGMHSCDTNSFKSKMLVFLAYKFALINGWNDIFRPKLVTRYFGTKVYDLIIKQTGQPIEITSELAKNEIFTQTFINKEDELIGISMMINTFNGSKTCLINVKILDEKNNLIFNSYIDTKQPRDNAFYDLSFNKSINTWGQTFKIIITSLDGIKGSSACMSLTDKFEPGTEFFINNNKINNKSLVYKLYYRKKYK